MGPRVEAEELFERDMLFGNSGSCAFAVRSQRERHTSIKSKRFMGWGLKGETSYTNYSYKMFHRQFTPNDK
jgi:hypothetical protein